MSFAVLALALLAPRHLAARAPSILGEWSPWRITEGDALVTPPKRLAGSLVFKRDGTFRLWVHYGFGDQERGSGTFRLRGHLLTLKYKGWLTNPGSKKIRQSGDMLLFERRGQLWDGSYVDGDGSCIYVRPGETPKMPRSEKNWPSMEDFYSTR